MALKTVAGTIDFVNWNDVEIGSTLKGFLKEIRPSKKSGWDPTVLVENVEGTKVYGLGGKANLVRNLEENVKVGWYVEITYLGKIKLETGDNAGQMCHQFQIAYDDERIRPFVSGDASARQQVEYKNSEAAPQQAPPLAAPQQAPALAAPQQPPAAPQQTEAAPQQQQAAAAPAQKRSFF